MEKFAQVISGIFSPVAESLAIIWLATNMNITFLGWTKVFSLSLFFIFFLPYGFFFYLKKNKKISDNDISKRGERHRFNIFTFFSIALFLAIMFFFNEKALVFFYLRLLTPFFIYIIITFFWKISGHMVVNSIFVQLIYFYTKNPLLLLLGIFVLFLVGWSRVYLKRHTLVQVSFGGLLPLIILIF